SNFKDFLKLNEKFDVVITKFLKIKKKTFNIYWQESNIFKNQIDFYIKAINSSLGEIRFDYKN
ncbi:hypothetical protein II654_01605, partial [bacterium]|nr:hypothetical protein [bacterium]